MADEETKRQLTIQQATQELIDHCETLGIPKLKAAQQILGKAVTVMKEEGYELSHLLADLTRHWGHIPEKN